MRRALDLAVEVGNLGVEARSRLLLGKVLQGEKGIEEIRVRV